MYLKQKPTACLHFAQHYVRKNANESAAHDVKHKKLRLSLHFKQVARTVHQRGSIPRHERERKNKNGEGGGDL